MSRSISRYILPCATTGTKTGRHYGAVVSVIRRVASRGKPFTRRDLAGLDRKQAASQLFNLYRAGELRQVKAGRPGRGDIPAIYQLNH